MFGLGDLVFEVIEDWGSLPEGWSFRHVIGVTIDSSDLVYVFNRSEHPVVVFDRLGNFVKSWGEGVFKNPHGIHVDVEDNIYCSDSGDHTVRKFTKNGELLRTWGVKDHPEDGAPFNRPADVAFAPSGEMYVADGYGNSRVHKFSEEGELLLSWGEPGDGPGQFDLPHDVWVYKDGRVFVADRQNNRIQIFSFEGEYLDEWTGLLRPCSLYIDSDDLVYVSELRARFSILDIEGNLLARWGGEESKEPGLFIAPHCSWLDSHGDLYIGETLEGSRIQKFTRVK
jgi:DNA-binding beta-propeller fold protein YncE